MKPVTRTDNSSMMSEQGFNLVELIIAMAIFMGIIIISSQAFLKILSMSGQQTQSSESDTQGVVGLEMMRFDLEHAGYGLPWLIGYPPPSPGGVARGPAYIVARFDEGQAAPNYLAPGIDSEQFNDLNIGAAAKGNDASQIPRAVQSAASTTDGKDYLVIKSVLAGMSDSVKKWSYVEGIGATSRLKVWGTNDYVADELVITFDSRTKRLIATSTTQDPVGTGPFVIDSTMPANFSYKITAANMVPPDAFKPENDNEFYVTYSVWKSATKNLRVPYNRVDYFVKRPSDEKDIPARCAKGAAGQPGTGILYKAVMSHDGGGFTQYPLVECIADMQVVYSLDTNGDGAVDGHVDQNGLSGLTAKEIRAQLKEIRVSILSHEGGKDTNFQYSASTIDVGEFGAGRTFDLNANFGASYVNYRWKVYKLVVVPRNINY